MRARGEVDRRSAWDGHLCRHAASRLGGRRLHEADTVDRQDTWASVGKSQESGNNCAADRRAAAHARSCWNHSRQGVWSVRRGTWGWARPSRWGLGMVMSIRCTRSGAMCHLAAWQQAIASRQAWTVSAVDRRWNRGRVVAVPARPSLDTAGVVRESTDGGWRRGGAGSAARLLVTPGHRFSTPMRVGELPPTAELTLITAFGDAFLERPDSSSEGVVTQLLALNIRRP